MALAFLASLSKNPKCDLYIYISIYMYSYLSICLSIYLYIALAFLASSRPNPKCDLTYRGCDLAPKCSVCASATWRRGAGNTHSRHRRHKFNRPQNSLMYMSKANLPIALTQ